MDFDYTQDHIAELLAQAMRCELSTEEGRFCFNSRRISNAINLQLEKRRLQEIIDSIKKKQLHEETTLYDEISYEVIVKEESSAPFRRFREEKLEVRDIESGLLYELSPASDEYLIWLIVKISQQSSIRDFGFAGFMTSRVERVLADEKSKLSFLDFFRLTSLRLLTLKIVSDNKIPLRKFTQLTYAFLFQLGYNLDVTFVPQRYIEELSRRVRITRMRRGRSEEIEPPRRVYNDDLIHHYLSAISTDNPVVEYLSYYHILEHFFEAVFNDDLVENIRGHITHPGFSYKRKKDIAQLIAVIKKSLQIRSETITFSESEALRLCLVKFVDLRQLDTKLKEYDQSLVNYYRTQKVPFTEGPTVDLEIADDNQIFKDLTKRIYSTRNALVHSKDTEMSKYTPFVDERALVFEIPLMRFISEMVILAVSEVV